MEKYSEYKKKMTELQGKMADYKATFMDWCEYWKLKVSEPENQDTVDLNGNPSKDFTYYDNKPDSI